MVKTTFIKAFRLKLTPMGSAVSLPRSIVGTRHVQSPLYHSGAAGFDIRYFWVGSRVGRSIIIGSSESYS